MFSLSFVVTGAMLTGDVLLIFLIYISLMINDIEHLLISLLECLFNTLPIFNEIVFFVEM